MVAHLSGLTVSSLDSLLGGNYIIRLATIMMMYMVISLSWNFIGGFRGIPPLQLPPFLVLALMWPE